VTARAAPLRALVVDDEPLARKRIRALLADEPDIDVVGEAGGGSEAIRLIGSARPDLVFLDVQMPGHDGFDVLRASAPTHLPMVIFVTAHDAHAIRAFEVAAADYLLKPVVEERFRAAVRRAVDRVRGAHSGDISRQLTTLLEQLPAFAAVDRVPIRSDGRVTFVKVREIDWVDVSGDHVRLHVGKATHLLRETMSELEARLPASSFMRIHRSIIVNVERIREVQPWFKGDHVLILTDGTRLTSGRTYRERVQQLLK
jgi:two-component system LytT family response regulator